MDIQIRDDACIMLVMFILIQLRDDVGEAELHHARYDHASTY
jgi:hypothetical protein